jgi:hypothetical protein
VAGRGLTDATLAQGVQRVAAAMRLKPRALTWASDPDVTPATDRRAAQPEVAVARVAAGGARGADRYSGVIMMRRGTVWLLVGALLGALLTATISTPASAADITRYYYAADPANGFGGYAVRVHFRGNTAYLLAPMLNSTCTKATRVASRKWRYKQPIAAEAGDPVTAWFKTNKARTRVKFNDQYENYDLTYRQISRAKALRWLAKTGSKGAFSRRC